MTTRIESLSPGDRPNHRSLVAFAGLAVITTLLVANPVHAQGQTAAIDKIFSWVTPTSPGCAIAASHHGTVVVNRGYGSANLEHDMPISSDSVFDAASVVKQFVAAATLVLVEEGRLSLNEDIHTYVPELPDYGHTITLDHLMTHTSGIRDWTGLGPLTGRRVDALSLTLRQRRLNFVPGEEWSYSNSGYVLLNPRGALSFMSQDEFELHFVTPDVIALTSLEGKTTRFRRAQPYAPTADDLRAFVGRFANDENRAVFEVAAAGGGLTVHIAWNNSQALEFQPVDRDTFQLGGMILRFVRDQAGKVVSLDYSNPVVRDIEFTRTVS